VSFAPAPASASTQPSSWRERVLVALAGFVLVTILTWPTVPGLGTYGRVDTGDGRYSIWNVGWIDHALLTDPSHLLDANIFYPHTGTLAYSELNLVAGVFGLPVFAITGNSVAATNAAIVVALVLAFVLMWALVRRLTGSSAAGVCAATGFTFCPFVQAHTAHIQLLMVFAFPLVLLTLDAYVRRPDVRRAIGLGAALAIAGLACAYYGIFVGITLVPAALVLASRRWQYFAGLGASAVVAGLLVLPVFVPYMRARAAVAASPANPQEVRDYSATLDNYRSSPSWVHEHTPILKPSLESVFPGFILLGLATIGAVSVWRQGTAGERRLVAAYLAIAIVTGWASFGPDAGLYRVLQRAVPVIDMLRAPVRLGVVVTFAVAVIAGFGVRAIARSRPSRAWVIVPALALELFTLPWPIVRVPAFPEAYRRLATLPRGPVIEFLFNYKRTDFLQHTHYMFGSTAHWQPLLNGYSDVTPPDFGELAATINDFPDPPTLARLRSLGVRYAIWHRRTYNDEAWAKIMTRLAPYTSDLRKITDADDVWLYEILR